MIRFEIITAYDAFASLQPAWNELVMAPEVDQAFMKYEWFDTWIRSLELTDQIHVVVGRRAGQIVAIAPMMLRRERLRFLTFTALTFLQSAVSPRCNLILADTSDLPSLMDFIRSHDNWDLMMAHNMEANLGTTRSFVDYLEQDSGARYVIQDGRQSPYLIVDQPWDQYLKNLPKKRRDFLKSECLNRLAKANQYAIHHITPEHSLTEVVDQMVAISARSWKQEKGTAIGQVACQLALYTEFTLVALPRGWVDIWMLEINNTMVAFDYYLVGRDLLSLIRTDFDTEYRWYHPGENLRIAVLKELGSRAMPAVLDLGGMPTAYKMRWATGIRRHVSVTLGGRTLGGRTAMAWKRSIKPLLKRILIE